MIRFLVNPAAGRGSGARALERLRQLAAGAGAELTTSRDAADLARQAREAVEAGAERLVVAGGDGTFHHALQSLAGSDCALGLVPLGSGNDFATCLGAPQDLDRAVAAALEGPVDRIDLLKAADRIWCGIYCGVGFDSEVTRYANEEVRWLRGALIYPWAVLCMLFRFKPPRIRVEHDGGVFEGRAMFTTAANCHSFGGGMKIAPDARPDDGLIDLVMVREISRAELLRVFPRVYRGTHLGHPAVEIVRTRRAHIRLDREMEMFGDGEAMLPVGPEGVEVVVVPGALKVASNAPA